MFSIYCRGCVLKKNTKIQEYLPGRAGVGVESVAKLHVGKSSSFELWSDHVVIPNEFQEF